MKKGFIENIEGDNVYIMLDDNSTLIMNIKNFPETIKLDMIVEIDNEGIKVFNPDKELKKEIDKVTKEIFVSFKDRKKK